MLFGEKYGERVRVIRYGESVELCGGTHVARTGNIGFFKILSESATSAGVRRIEAVTAQRAAEFVYGLEDTLRGIQQYVNNPSVTQAIKKLVEENAELNKQIEEGKRERIRSIVESIEPTLTEEDGIVLIARQADFLPDIVKGIAFGLKPKFPNLVFVIGSAVGGKPALTVMLGDEIVSRGVDASKVVREAAKEISGGGGGQPIHDGQEFAEKRAPVLYAIDKKKPIRFSHENPEVNRLYETYLEKPCSPKSHHLLHVEHKI